MPIERSREDLELEIAELRERAQWLEAQVAAMLASPKYDPLGSRLPPRLAAPDVVMIPNRMAWTGMGLEPRVD